MESHHQVPDEAPADDLVIQRSTELMDTIEGFCRESCLAPREIVGCLEGVKFSMLRRWFAEAEAE